MNNGQRDNLRETYDKYAAERDAYDLQEWKAKERSAFLSLLLQEHKKTLLEIGAGAGHDGRFFHDQGFEVVCIDLSPAMVEICRKKGLTAYVMDMCDIRLPGTSFDAIYSMNSLLHLSKAEFPAILHRIDALLKPAGMVFIGVYGGYDFEGVWEKDFYTPKRFFSFFTDEHIEQEMTKVFDMVSFNRVLYEPESPMHFQSLILRKKLSISAAG